MAHRRQAAPIAKQSAAVAVADDVIERLGHSAAKPTTTTSLKANRRSVAPVIES